MATLAVPQGEVNPAERARRNAVAKLRRLARHSNMRVLSHRNPETGGYSYKLQTAIPNTDWTSLEETTTVVEDLYCIEVRQ